MSCTTCKKKVKLMYCSKCHCTPYCSRICQKDDWKEHSKTCQVLKPLTYFTAIDETTAKQMVEGKFHFNENNIAHKSIVLYKHIIDNDRNEIMHVLSEVNPNFDMRETYLLIIRHCDKITIATFMANFCNDDAAKTALEKQMQGNLAPIVAAFVENSRIETDYLPNIMQDGMYCPRIAEALLSARGMPGFEIAKKIFPKKTFDIEKDFVRELVERKVVSERNANAILTDSSVRLT